MSAPDGQRFHLVFAAIADPDGVPPIPRLRRLLKAALRSYRLRCVKAYVEDAAGETQPLPADGGQEQAEEAGPS